MKALIDTTTPVQYIEKWENKKPVFATYENSARVAQVSDVDFPVAAPLFWIDCGNDVIADQFYYNTTTKEILPVISAPPEPAPEPLEK